MKPPPPYPRVSLLVASGRGASDDRVLDPRLAEKLLGRRVLVEEKLDGANVSVWLEGGRIESSLRAGPGAVDRGRQLGPLRAWLGERLHALPELLREHALYGEWLYLTHGVPYDLLPSYFVGLDLWSPVDGFLPPLERNRRLVEGGIAVPPELFRGKPETASRLESLMTQSGFGTGPMEGLVIRTLDGSEPRVAKLLRPGYQPATDSAWTSGRPRNQLREKELSWH
jgi:RNA ligase